MPDNPTIVLVGHCGPDMFMLRSAIGRAVPEAEIVSVNADETLQPHLDAGSLLLVNRVLDGRFDQDGTNGIELIRRVAGDGASVRAMLISNFPEAQAEAESAGAVAGFGKSDLYDAATAERLRSALA